MRMNHHSFVTAMPFYAYNALVLPFHAMLAHARREDHALPFMP